MPQLGMGYLGVGDSHKALKKWQSAITAYSKALQLLTGGDSKQLLVQATLKRGMAYYHLQMYQQAMVDL
jgi:tetratricopeptide (TPR) repeat protein